MLSQGGRAALPIVSARTVFAQIVTGLFRAMNWRSGGIFAGGTNTELMNVSGKIQMKLAACTDSTSLIASPIVAEIHENAKPTNAESRIAASAEGTPLSNENPTR